MDFKVNLNQNIKYKIMLNKLCRVKDCVLGFKNCFTNQLP